VWSGSLGVSGKASDFDQVQAERLDAVEQPAQRRLVVHRSVQDRLHRLDGRAQALKRRQQEVVAQLPLDPDLVASSTSGHE
jgi:hypothetical protein